ncbi:MAG: DUF4314 domain-containing protein [Waltera sp.]
MLSKAEVDEIKRMYPQGMKIRLIEMQGEPQMPDGLEGKVKMVDDAGQIHVAWSNGSSLALNTEKDYFEAVITQEYLDQRRREPWRKNRILEKTPRKVARK